MSKVESTRPWAAIKIAQLPVSVRVDNSLFNEGVTTLGDLLRPEWDEVRLSRIGGFGRQSIKSLKVALESLGYSIGVTPHEAPLLKRAPLKMRRTVKNISGGYSLTVLADDGTVWTWIGAANKWQALPPLPERVEES